MKANVIEWLLEKDGNGIDYPAMRDLTNASQPELEEARERVHREGPIAKVLDAMNPEGWWVKPGAGYSPKYSGTVWSLILLSQLGASVEADSRLSTACNYCLDHAMTPDGLIAANGTPSQTMDCLQGNMLAALLEMGYHDPRMDKAFEWMAMTVTGDGIAPQGDKTTALRYYSGKCGPGFCCGANYKLPCAWGAVKVMLAFSKLPEEKRTDLINRAIQTGVDFFLAIDPSTAEYPCGYAEKPSGNWWKFGFPVFYVSDILQIAEALAGLGLATDPRMKNTLDYIRNKQDSNGYWLLEYDYRRKTWLEFGAKKLPNKWVTLRAMRVLKDVNTNQ